MCILLRTTPSAHTGRAATPSQRRRLALNALTGQPAAGPR
jgi:hypothetical protein